MKAMGKMTKKTVTIKNYLTLAGLKIPASIFTERTNGAEILYAYDCETDTSAKVRYVDVRGVIYPEDISAPNIEWQILLPFQWNGKTLQYGGGANNGSIPQLKEAPVFCSVIPLEEGYIVYGSDSGHQSLDPMNAEFAANEEALENYIRLQLIKMHMLMRYIVQYVYEQKPELNFFAGGSTGGREALECATTYGKYYDGIFCAEPSCNYVLLRMWGAILSQAVYETYDARNYPFSDGFIDEATVEAIQKDAIDYYDDLDGIRDGFVSNIYAARMQRNEFLKIITEKYGLTDAQLKTLDVYENGFKLKYSLPNGFDTYYGYNALEGGLMDLGSDPVPREPLDTKYNVHHGDRADGVFKYIITKDHSWKLIEHDYFHPDKKLYKTLMEASLKYDVNSPNFDDFIAHGGKIIFLGGWNDMSISPWQMIYQYRGYLEKYGKDKLDSFFKFYIMPSITHCAGMTMDYLEWLSKWCTENQYPSEPLYGNMDATGGQMPMAEFPGWVRYVGGDTKKGESYEICYDIADKIWEMFETFFA